MGSGQFRFRAEVAFRQESGLGRPWPYCMMATVCTFLESFPSFDQLAQLPFFRNGRWLITAATHAEYKGVFYTAPKVAIGCIGGMFLLLFLASYLKKWRSRLHAWRRPALLIACSIACVPLTVAALKALCGVYSPIDLLPYGGSHPHIGFLKQVLLHGATSGGHSFPAGHASGGFALVSLYFLPVGAFWKRAFFMFGLFAGWSMGCYQMARGEHFLSHTLTTMFLALGLIAWLARRVRADSL